MVGAVGIGREVAPRIVERLAQRPAIGNWIIHVDFVGRIRRHSASTHHIHLSVEVKPSRFPSGSRYRRNRANAVSYWIEAERVGGVYHQATLVI